MTVYISAYRDQPITRPGRVEQVRCNFGIGPEIAPLIGPEGPWQPSEENLKARIAEGLVKVDVTPWPQNPDSTFEWSEGEDGGQIELLISLADDTRAPDLIRELRSCGFVAGVDANAS
jgi:hypothetical protein